MGVYGTIAAIPCHRNFQLFDRRGNTAIAIPVDKSMSGFALGTRPITNYNVISGLMTVISKATTLRAIKHLVAFGDTDIFPRLPEINFLTDKSDEISEQLSKIQPGAFTPSSALELLVPKGFQSFRIAHQLDIFDSLMYLSSTLAISKDIEDMRTTIEDGTAFSYRFIGNCILDKAWTRTHLQPRVTGRHFR